MTVRLLPFSLPFVVLLALGACGTEEETIDEDADADVLVTTDADGGPDDAVNEVGDSSACPAGPEAPLGAACASEGLRCAYGYDRPGCGGRTVICSGGQFIEESHTDPSAECFADASSVDAGLEPEDVLRTEIFFDHCVFNEGFMCPAGCYPMNAYPYDEATDCVSYADGPTHVDCSNYRGGTDDAPCVKRLSDGALFIATSGTAFAESTAWVFCSDEESERVQSAQDCAD